MKLAVLIPAGDNLADQQVRQACKLAKLLDVPITGMVTTEEGIAYYPGDASGFAEMVQANIQQAEARIEAGIEAFKRICDDVGVAKDWYGRHGHIRQEWPPLSSYFDVAIVTAHLSAPEIASIGVAATIQLSDDTTITNFDERCVIAWDGSAPVARAVRAGLPLLRRFRQIDIITVDAKSRTLPTDIGSYLAAHGIEATINTEISGDDTVASLILDQAKNADLLIMGAYGLSTILEKLFGGVTETVRKNCKTPVLFAH